MIVREPMRPIFPDRAWFVSRAKIYVGGAIAVAIAFLVGGWIVSGW